MGKEVGKELGRVVGKELGREPGGERRGPPGVLGDLLSLVIPVHCAGCGRWDAAVCGRCQEVWSHPVQRSEEGSVYLAARDVSRDVSRGTTPYGQRAAREAGRLGFPVWTTTAYSGPAARMILGWKSGVRPDMAPFLADVARRAATQIAPLLATTPVFLIPAPSGWRRRAKRQFVVGPLAQAFAGGLPAVAGQGAGTGHGGKNVVVLDALRTSNGSLHAAGAAGRARRRTMRLVRSVPGAAFIVDDVLTTGATLAAARRALTAAGTPVVGAWALAATPPPGQTHAM